MKDNVLLCLSKMSLSCFFHSLLFLLNFINLTQVHLLLLLIRF